MRIPLRQPRARRWTLAVAGLLTWQLAAAGPAAALPGDLDPSFGGDGKVTTAFAGDAGANAVVVQDGKLVAARSAVVGTSDFALARYNRDGSLDRSFGTGGRVTTDFGGGGAQAQALVVQADGKLVAAGLMNDGTANADFAVARYRPNGTLDPSFGTGGRVGTDLGAFDVARALVVQDGRLVAAGLTFTGEFASGNFALARYRQNGVLDTSFGAGGTVTTDFAGGEDRAEALVAQGDRVVAAGSTVGASGGQQFALARYR
jgi:uncharacterized delta-60 repeat protein